jgi:hypothetical protein
MRKAMFFLNLKQQKQLKQQVKFFLYEDIDRGGRNIPFDVDAFGLNVPDIGTYSFNDRLSSFEMVLNYLIHHMSLLYLETKIIRAFYKWSALY